MLLECDNEWPDALREAMTTGLIGWCVGIDRVDYRIEGYDPLNECYIARRAGEDGMPLEGAPTEQVSFPNAQTLVIY